MRDCIRLCTVVCVIGVIASMGGFEHGQYSLAGMFGRIAIFSLMAGVCVVLDEVLTQRKRAKRRAILKAQRKNKYEVICHE